MIASISHDDNHLTQRWVVMVNGKEVFRANTLMRCDRFICTHYKDGSLPVQEQLATPCTTGNEVMAQIFDKCEKYGYEILDDGIYHNNMRLDQVGCTNGDWWVMRTGEWQQMPCSSAVEAVQSLSIVETSPSIEPTFEELLDRPFEMLAPDEWQRLRMYKPSTKSRELVTA
ncbi:hypothetical protein H6G97_40640 [Nostoc flagelliforme FACHB-838]|uniref:Uncharacterized protein n=1 Tax=Nostoc flagelliforme FACHB-838 TaxID=2692904 RepID=A0ABR8E1A0_9NOSO|nr:hypothetical protein [Nostoc flagelliforme]MBD2535371.1 hypothetical protein [Nostoc flagelliforme FACHB-838]